MNLTTLCTTVKTALTGAVSGLTVELYEPTSANPPQAWVEALGYTPETFGDTSGLIPLRVSVVVSRSDNTASFEKVYTLISDDTLGAALRATTLQIATLTYGNIGTTYPIGELTMLGFTIDLAVLA